MLHMYQPIYGLILPPSECLNTRISALHDKVKVSCHQIYFRFNEFLRDLLDSDGNRSTHARPRELRISRSLLMPKKGSVYDYVYTKKSYGSWNRWENLTVKPDLSDATQVILENIVIIQ